jgi:hypothetical protein
MDFPLEGILKYAPIWDFTIDTGPKERPLMSLYHLNCGE